ncbi:MAG: hypothetical protein HYY18_17465 [Planctomycetes bacterium]|nr:hypothetical protein [Planctomycetota bacterium]
MQLRSLLFCTALALSAGADELDTRLRALATRLSAEDVAERESATRELLGLTWRNPEGRRRLLDVAQSLDDPEAATRFRAAATLTRDLPAGRLVPGFQSESVRWNDEAVFWGRTVDTEKGGRLVGGARFDTRTLGRREVPAPPLRDPMLLGATGRAFYVVGDEDKSSDILRIASYDLQAGLWQVLPRHPVVDSRGYTVHAGTRWFAIVGSVPVRGAAVVSVESLVLHDAGETGWVDPPKLEGANTGTRPTMWNDTLAAVTPGSGLRLLAPGDKSWRRLGDDATLAAHRLVPLSLGPWLILYGYPRKDPGTPAGPFFLADPTAGRLDPLPDPPVEFTDRMDFAGDAARIVVGHRGVTDNPLPTPTEAPDWRAAWLDVKTRAWTAIPAPPFEWSCASYGPGPILAWNLVTAEGAEFQTSTGTWTVIPAPEGVPAPVSVVFASRGVLVSGRDDSAGSGAAFWMSRVRRYLPCPGAAGAEMAAGSWVDLEEVLVVIATRREPFQAGALRGEKLSSRYVAVDLTER